MGGVRGESRSGRGGGGGSLKSPGMVAAILASAPHHSPDPIRNSVKTKRDLFERGMSEPNMRIPKGRVPLERGESCDSFRWRKENEAQRLVKYRSASSIASSDSGLCLSRSGSIVGSSEDLRHSPLSRSASSERLPRRRSSGGSCSSRASSLTRSSTSACFGRHVHDDAPARQSRHSHYEASSPASDLTASTPDLVLPDLLPSPPPLPPKKRPPLPPRRSSSDAPPLPPKYLRSAPWDGESDGGSEDTSDTSLPEFLVDGEDSLEAESPHGSVQGNIPESFPFRDPLHKFLSDLGHALSTQVVIKNVRGTSPGQLDLHAHTSPIPSPAVFSLPQSSAPARPPSLSPAASPLAPPDRALTKKYRTELQVKKRYSANLCRKGFVDQRRGRPRSRDCTSSTRNTSLFSRPPEITALPENADCNL